MESEHSYSGDSSSSSDSSSGSSDGDDEVLEPVRIMGQSLELPQELCEDYSVFKEFFSMKTWEALEDKHKEELSKYLPQFTENEEEEKEKTIKMLFNHEPFHFTSPLGDFYNNLRQGNYRPDIAKMRKFLMKARAKQQKHKVIIIVVILKRFCSFKIFEYCQVTNSMLTNKLCFSDKVLLC